MKLLVLYEELAPYFFNNIQHFAAQYQTPILIVVKKVNPIAPFQFENKSKYVEVIDRSQFSISQMIDRIRQFQPTCLMQAGWIYPTYFEITEALKLPLNILLLDNQWKNSWRQKVGSTYFRWRYKQLFQKALVPGEKQKSFAEHLGFDEKDIEMGFYCCDTQIFQNIYLQRKKRKKRNYTFLYIGRYAPEKNIEMLWNAFIEACETYPNEWKLLCIGKGNITPIKHSQIIHLGFLQPKELADVLMKVDVFVLPSIFEPWGVVIHEMVAAGLPIISSSEAGANEFFVRHQENGFVFHPQDKEELKKYLKQLMSMSDESYFNMCEKSYELSQKITTDSWIKKIHHLCTISN